jgi:sulfatase modifying factor 1
MGMRSVHLLAALSLVVAAWAMEGCFRGCPQTESEFCGSRTCGEVTEPNACGEVQTVDCGQCFGPDVCGGAGTPNVCSFCKHPAVTRDCVGGCRIPAGCFPMGSDGSPCTNDVIQNPMPFTTFGQETRHEVALTHSFEMMDAEVTQGAFSDLMSYRPARNENQDQPFMPDNPVEYVSWHEAAAYANALSAKEGHPSCYSCSGDGAKVVCGPAGSYTGARVFECPGYRLPTDAEWEYAFRAGQTTDFYAGYDLDAMGCHCKHDFETQVCACDEKTPPTSCDELPFYVALNDTAWWGHNSGGHHHPVRTAPKTNPWGLYDMAGNVFEWCHDWVDSTMESVKATDPWGKPAGAYKVVRGAAFDWGEVRFFRASTRRLETVDHVCYSVGFRLVRTIKSGPL